MNDIYNILFADTGRLDALSSNLFFQEAGQLLINAINLFEQGYFDCAFYSLRQSVEISLGSLYLTAQQSKLKDWDNQKGDFDVTNMFKYLEKEEPTFKNMLFVMSDYFKVFQKTKKTKKTIDKYVHKQGYKTFYSVRKTFDYKKIHPIEELVNDFEKHLIFCIGAVAVYRLAIDPLPVLLMDESIDKKMSQMITEAFSDSFVEKYIGLQHIEKYKQTEVYTSYYEYFSQFETQNDAVYEIKHCDFVDRERKEQIISQAHLLTKVQDKLMDHLSL